MKRALTLSGGGSRGAYQIGVWKALRELNIKYDIITGTSVGALNGALMVQDTYDMVKDFWLDIDFKEVFDDDFFQGDNLINKKNSVIRKYINAALFKKGLDISSLEKNLDTYLNEDLFYKSEIDYGLVTYDLKNRTPVMLRKQDIPREKLKDYIIASATFFPIFKKKKIGDNYYIDGGYYDNLPINLAIEMGATEVIAVYISSLGLRKPVKNKDIKITYIEPKSKLGFPAFFDKKLAIRHFHLGYNDTMKAFGKYEGNVYTFKNNELSIFYKNNKDYILEVINSIFKSDSKGLLSSRLKRDDIIFNDFVKHIEFIGALFDIDESRSYTMEQFNQLLIKKYAKFNDRIEKNILNKYEASILNNRKLILRKVYTELNSIDKESSRNTIVRLSVVYPRVTMAAIYLYSVLENVYNK